MFEFVKPSELGYDDGLIELVKKDELYFEKETVNSFESLFYFSLILAYRVF